MIKMPLSLKEKCYLRMTGNVNSEKLPGMREKHEHNIYRGEQVQIFVPSLETTVLLLLHFYL